MNLTISDSLPSDQIPTVELVSPGTGTIDSDGSVTFTCNATDDIDIVNMTLYTNLTGSFIANQTNVFTGTTDTFNETSFNLVHPYNETLVWNCLVYDNASNSSWASANFSLTIQFPVAPTNPSPDLATSGATNYSTQNLDCTDTINDPNDDVMNVSVRWYKGGAYNRTDHFNSSYASGTVFNGSLGSANTSTDDVWLCSIRLYDSTFYSAWVNSSSLTVLAAPPPSNISLRSPATGSSTPDTLIEFLSNMTDNEYVVNATLYTNDTGTWTARETRWNGEVAYNDTALVVLYHFNNESAFGESDSLGV